MKRRTGKLLGAVALAATLSLTACGAQDSPNTDPRQGWVAVGADPAGNTIYKLCDGPTLLNAFPGEGLATTAGSSECAADGSTRTAALALSMVALTGGGSSTAPKSSSQPARSPSNQPSRQVNPATTRSATPATGTQSQSPTSASSTPSASKTKAKKRPPLKNKLPRRGWVSVTYDVLDYSIDKRCDGSTLLYIIPGAAVSAVDKSPECDLSAAPDTRARNGWVQLWDDSEGHGLSKVCDGPTLVYELEGEGAATIAGSSECDPAATGTGSSAVRSQWVSLPRPWAWDTVHKRCTGPKLMYAIAEDALSLVTASPSCGASAPANADIRKRWVDIMADPQGTAIYGRCFGTTLYYTLDGDGLATEPRARECV